MIEYNNTDDPFSDTVITSFKNAVRESRYFLEVINHCNTKNGGRIPMINFMTASSEFCFLYNVNMGRYIMNFMYSQIVPSDSIYKKKFNEGYASFEKSYGSAPPLSHKSWNVFSHIYNTVIKKELLDEKTEFTDEDMQRAFYISGIATRYSEFEEEYSIIVASYFSLEAVGDVLHPFAKIPIINRYHGAISHSSKRTKPVPKVEFIILKETGVVDDLIKTMTISEAASSIATMINEKFHLEDSADKCSAANIRNILIADAYSPDAKSVKSAYKKNNIKKALVQLASMGVALDRCKYLSVLNLTNPDLFI